MYNFFKNEFKRCFFSKITFLGMAITFICLVIPYIDDLKIPYPNADGIIFFIRSSACLPLSYLPLLAPLIACIPSATTYIVDKKSGILNYILLKMKRKKYITIRIAVNFLVSGLVLVIPQIIMLIFLIIRHGINNTSIEVVGAFSSVFYNSKIAYVTIMLVVFFISSAVFSTFALGISSIVENKYLTIILPYIYVIISGTVFEMVEVNRIVNLNVMTLFDIGYNLDLTSLNVILYELALFIMGVLLFYYFGEKKNYA